MPHHDALQMTLMSSVLAEGVTDQSQVPTGSATAFIGVLAFLAGAVATAIAMELVRRFFDRPRPTLWVTEVSLSPRSTDLPLQLDFKLIALEQQNLLVPKLDSELTLKGARQYVKQASAKIQHHHTVMKHLEELIQSLPHGDQVLSDEQRITFLRRWTEFSDTLDTIELLALGIYLDDIPSRYKEKHPPDKAQLVVELRPGATYRLSEIDEDAEYARVLREKGQADAERRRHAVHITNITRRYWVHGRTGDLRWLWTKMLEVCSAIENESNDLVQSLQAVIDANAQDYVRVHAVVLNRGVRPFTAHPAGALAIPLGAHNRAIVPLEVEGREDSSPSPIVVDGNRAVQITFSSEVPLALLSIKDSSGTIVLDDKRVRAIFNARNSKSRLGLSISGYGVKEATVVASEEFEFQPGANDRLQTTMMRYFA